MEHFIQSFEATCSLPACRKVKSECNLSLTCTDRLALQHHSVEDEADVFGGLWGAWALFAQQVQDFCGQHRVLAVLDKLAQMGQACLFALRVLLDDADDAVHDGPLVLKATLQAMSKVSD